MLLRRFQIGNTWDRLAAAQQLCILLALYHDHREGVELLADGSAQILAWQLAGGFTWPPSWCVLKDQDEQFFIVLNGTTNVRQGGGHMQGAFITAEPFRWSSGPGGQAYVNGAWAALWDTLWPDIRALLPADLRDRVICFSGHSYGGAVAQLFASYLLREVPEVRAQVLTFGQPRVWTPGYTGPIPAACYVLYSTEDPVASLPPFGLSLELNSAAMGFTPRVIQGLSWQHYGTVEQLGMDGSNSNAAWPAVPWPPFVERDRLQQHGVKNYFGRVAASYRRQLAGEP